MTKRPTSDKLQIACSQFRSAFEDGNDATITKTFICPVFVEVKPSFPLVIEEIEVLLGKFLLDCLLVFATRKVGRAVYTKAVGIDFKYVGIYMETIYFYR